MFFEFAVHKLWKIRFYILQSGLFQKIRACVRYNQKRARKSSKRAQLWVFTPLFSKFGAFRTLHPPLNSICFRSFQQRECHFVSQKGHCAPVPHAISGQNEPWQLGYHKFVYCIITYICEYSFKQLESEATESKVCQTLKGPKPCYINHMSVCFKPAYF